MNKIIILLLIALCPIVSLAQKTSNNKGDRLFYLTSIDFVLPQKKEYSYRVPGVSFIGTELENSGFLLRSFGVTASANYFLFRSLSIGLEGGFQTQSRPTFSFFKLGGVLRLFVDSDKDVNIFLSVANDFSLDKSKFRDGGNFRFGFGFPVKRFINQRINLNLFYELHSFNLRDAEPLLGIPGEVPDRLTFRSFGLSAEFKW